MRCRQRSLRCPGINQVVPDVEDIFLTVFALWPAHQRAPGEVHVTVGAWRRADYGRRARYGVTPFEATLGGHLPHSSPTHTHQKTWLLSPCSDIKRWRPQCCCSPRCARTNSRSLIKNSANSLCVKSYPAWGFLKRQVTIRVDRC